MKYPDEFETPTFPAGKQIAVTRMVSVLIMSVFLLILFSCGLLLWAQKSVHVHPFLISVNEITGQWEIVGHQHTDVKEMSTVRTLQESVIGKFLEYHFFVTEDANFNANIWQPCDRKQHCNPETRVGMASEACSLYCLSSDNIHDDFIKNIVPQYQQMFTTGEIWTLDTKSVEMTPISEITSSGGLWQIRAKINSSLFGPIKILAYANVLQNLELYPQTLGYYIAEFNAYKIK